jgi:hypothetical protein
MYPPEVVVALKQALKSVYWYKDDLRRFFLAAGIPATTVTKQGWHDPQEYKVRIVERILDDLTSMGEQGLGLMRRLVKAVLDIPNFDHLRQLDAGDAKVESARRSVEGLRAAVSKHDGDFHKRALGREQSAAKIAEVVTRRNDEIERLRQRFQDLVATDDPQERGRQFEGFLQDMFGAYDLNPRGSFKIIGEQIDGAFELEGTQFLLEARWQKERQGAAALDSFSKKVERKLENTLGLFVSLAGFTDEGVTAFRGSRPSVILMDGEDLALVLQGFVDFRELLKHKVRRAAQTGDPYLKARDIGK